VTAPEAGDDGGAAGSPDQDANDEPDLGGEAAPDVSTEDSGTGGSAGNSGSGGNAGIGGTAGSAGIGDDAATDSTDENDAGQDAKTDATAEADSSDEPDAGPDAEESGPDVAVDSPVETDAEVEADATIVDSPADVVEADSPPACQNGTEEPCYKGPAGTEGVGECKGGTRTCAGGVWGVCADQVLPVAERCDWNTKDDDCDGVTDDVKAAPTVQLTTAPGNSGHSVAFAGGVLGITWNRTDQAWFGTANPLDGSRIIADKKVPNASGANSPGASIDRDGAAGFVLGTIDSLPDSPHAAFATAATDGTVAKNQHFHVNGGAPGNVDVSTDNSGSLVVYDANGPLATDVYYALWSGGSLATYGNLTAGAQPSRNPNVIWTGSQFLVFWQQDPGPKIVMRTISATGTPSGVVLPASWSDGYNPSPVATPAGPAFTFRPTSYGSVQLARVNPNLTSADFTTVSAEPGAKYEFADLGWNGTDFAVAWVQILNNVRTVKIVRIKADASALSPVTKVATTNTPGSVRIVWTGASWNIVWDANDNGSGRQLFWSEICE